MVMAAVVAIGVELNRLDFVGALVLTGTAVMVATLLSVRRSWGPAVVIIALAPFQGYLIGQFGPAANLLTAVPIAAVLWNTRRRWHSAFLGSRVQRLAAVFIVALLAGVPGLLLSGLETEYVIESAQKVSLVFVLGATYLGMRDGEGVTAVAVTVVSATTTLFIWSMISSFGGLRLGPGPEGLASNARRSAVMRESLAFARLEGFEQSVGSNRLAFWGILPLCLAIGLWLSRGGRSRLIGRIGVPVIGIGILTTGSRSGTLGAAVAVVVVLLLWPRRHRFQALGLLAAVGIGVTWLLNAKSGGSALGRLLFIDPESSDNRRLAWDYALHTFAQNPLLGVGPGGFERSFSQTALYSRNPSLADSHNTFLQVLSEHGIVAAVPLVALVIVVMVRLLRGRLRNGPEAHWNAVFLAGFVGMLVAGLFNSYMTDKYLWIPIAYAAVSERAKSRHLVGAAPARPNVRLLRNSG